MCAFVGGCKCVMSEKEREREREREDLRKLMRARERKGVRERGGQPGGGTVDVMCCKVSYKASKLENVTLERDGILVKISVPSFFRKNQDKIESLPVKEESDEKLCLF